MQTKYSGLDLHFQFEEHTVHALNIIFERFTRTIPLHSHGNGCYEIHFIPYGYGKLQVQEHFFEIVPNTLYVTGPRVEHAQTPIPDNPMQEYCIYLKINRQKKAPVSPLMDSFLATRFWFGQDRQNSLALITQLFDELEHHRIGYLRQTELLLSQLIISLVRNYENCNPAQPVALSSGINDSKSVIIEDYFLYEYSQLSLEALSARLGLSARQTQRLLQEYYGSTFQQKKSEARMSAAATLLGDRSRSITSISDTLGYSSPEHFSGSFQKYYGTCPREFRKNLLDKNQ